MQLHIRTDYAVRIVLYAAQQGRVVSSGEISASMAVPRSMIAKIGNRLSDAGILTAKRGQAGGFALARHPTEISMGDVIRAMEGIHLNRCLEPDHFCSRGAAEACPVRAFYAQVQADLDAALSRKTIASLLGDAGNVAGKGGEGA